MNRIIDHSFRDSILTDKTIKSVDHRDNHLAIIFKDDTYVIFTYTHAECCDDIGGWSVDEKIDALDELNLGTIDGHEYILREKQEEEDTRQLRYSKYLQFKKEFDIVSPS